jgi:hypothetical protein
METKAKVNANQLMLMLIVMCTFSGINEIKSQNSSIYNNGELKLKLNEDGSHYIRGTFATQIWLRFNQNNPGTVIYGVPQNETFDIGIRRLRMQFYGQITDRVFFYTQLGENNFTYLSKQFSGFFVHDAVTEFTAVKTHLSLGAGLTGWSGLSRYASPAIGSIMSLDAPLYQQSTNGVNDQFLRKLSVYAKGKLGKLDYRLALSKPLAVQNAVVPVNSISVNSEFSLNPSKMQAQGYFMWQFLNQETDVTPYMTGTYLGKKKVFNIGAGFIYQPDAMWRKNGFGDTLNNAIQLFAVDVFYDAPVNAEKGNALTIYGAYHHFDFGQNYLRSVGVMNPAIAVNNKGTISGSGNGFPMIGTGDVGYLQIGYLVKKGMLPNEGRIQPYAALQVANYKKLNNSMVMMEAGVNYYIHGIQGSKISLNFQSRPVMEQQSDNRIITTMHKLMIQLQYQIML